MYKKFILKPISENTYEGIGFISKKNKIVKFEYLPLITLEELKNKEIYLILKPPQFFYEIYTLNLPLFQKEIVKLRLQERINSLGYFTKPVEIYWKILEKEENLYKIAYIAVDKEYIVKTLSIFKTLIPAKISVVTLLPLALQADIEDTEEYIIIHREKEGLWILISSEKIPYYIEFIPLDEELGINWTELISRINFLQNLFYRENQRELKKLYLSKIEEVEELRGINLPILSLEKPFPEFFGILKVDPSFNFLSEEEKALKEVLKKNYKVSYIILGLSILTWSLAFGLHQINVKIEREINRKEALIHESINRLFSNYPEAKVQALRNYLEEREKLTQLPKIEDLFLDLIYPLQDCRITQFEILNQNQTFEISITGEKKADLSQFTIFSERITKDLSKKLLITQRELTYSSEESKILFKIKGNLK